MEGVRPLGGQQTTVTGPQPRPRVPETRATAPAQPAGPVGAPIPSEPPGEVIEALNTAARVLEELARNNVQLRFAVDEESRQIEVVVTDGEGQVVRRIPPTKALSILADQRGRGLVLDELG